MRNILLLITGFAVVLLSGCGGSSSDDPDPMGGGSPAPISSEDIALIDAAMASIGNANLSQKVVTNVAEGGQTVFTFSDASQPITINSDVIATITENLSQWQVSVSFTDGRDETLVLQGNNLGLSSENIDLDPNGVTPLSAEVEIPLPVDGAIRIVIPGRGDDGITLEHTFDVTGDSASLPVLGLYADYNNSVEFHYYDVSGNALSTDVVGITTDALDAPPPINITVNNLPAGEDDLYMEVGAKHAFDQNGDFRWVMTGGTFAQAFDRLPNGNWLISDTTGVVIYHWPTFHEVDMLGNIIQTYSAPNLGHHEIKSMNNGNILIGSNSVLMTNPGWADMGTLQEDTVVEISATTGEVVKEYDFNLLLDNTRRPVENNIPDDWFHINSAIYDPVDDAIIVSGRHQGVAKVDRNSESLVWMLAPPEEWPAEFSDYLLTPVDAQGDVLDVTEVNFWPYGQHAALVLPNGNILLYDNGNNRGMYKHDPLPENEYSRAVEYRIDEQNMTIELVWEYDYGRQIYTQATGDVDYLAETDGRLISFMWDNAMPLATPRVVELDSDDNIIFEYTFSPRGYRTEKFDLYQGIQ